MTKPRFTAFAPTDAEAITLTFSPTEKRVVSLVYTSIIFSLLSDEVQLLDSLQLEHALCWMMRTRTTPLSIVSMIPSWEIVFAISAAFYR